ncbi:MAG: ABC transporter permease [Anaerolineales bacterium]
MRKLIILALKEVIVTFRDLGAIVTMLVSPVVLTLAIGAAFGTGGSATLSDIPVLLLNYDDGPMSRTVVDVFQSEDLEELLEVELVSAEEEARARVESDEVAALVIIPENFTGSAFPLISAVQEELGLDLLSLTSEETAALTPQQQLEISRLYIRTQEERTEEPVTLEIYASPEWQISTGVVKGVTTQAVERLHMMTTGYTVIASRLFQTNLGEGAAGSFGDLTSAGSMEMEGGDASDLPVHLQVVSPSGRSFNWLDYSAASMAILFLMFAVTSGGRTLLAERQWGTLPRLLISPTPALTVLVGKMGGIVLAGLLQVFVLWGATSLIGAYWGEPAGVIAAVLALVLAATGVGAIISAWSKTSGQAGAVGTAVTLAGAAFSGSFVPRSNLPRAVQTISLITPHAWGIEIFTDLQRGKGLIDILPLLGGLLLLTALYYAIAAVGFRRLID